MDPLGRKSYQIPLSVREEVAELMDKNSRTVAWSSEELAYLFQVYNRYIAKPGYAEKMNCGGCRTKVVSHMKYFTNYWKTHGIKADE